MKISTLLMPLLMLMTSTALAQSSGTTTTPLLRKDAVGLPGKELELLTVEYQPGATDPVHTHSAQAMVYVLEGTVVMQVKGGPPATLKAGDTFYETPGDVHVVARNASATERARFIVFFLKDKGTPRFVPVK
jgi:quercetin dioxygenase-like cupin family protein